MRPKANSDSKAPSCGVTTIWDQLVPRVVHPAKVIIIEALLWMGRPLSSSEIVALMEDEDYYISLVSYHLRHLADLGVADLVKKTARRGATEKYYALRDERTR